MTDLQPPAVPFRRWRAGVIGVALATHLGFCFLHYSPPTGDAAEYHALAVNLLTRHTFAVAGDSGAPTARRMPLFPVFLAGIYELTGLEHGASTAPVVQACLMVCNVALVIAVARRWFGEVPALFAGLLTCLYQAYLYLPTELLSENLYIPLLLAALWLLTRDAARPAWAFALAFVLLGLLVLTRANAVAVVPVAMIHAWKSLGGRRRAVRMVGLVACLLVPLIPWWVRNTITFGTPVLLATNGGWNLYLGHNPGYRQAPGLGAGTDFDVFDRLVREGMTEVEADRELRRRAVDFARSHPGQTLANLCRKTKTIFSVHTRQTWNLIAVSMVFFGLRAWCEPTGARRRKLIAALLCTAGILGWLVQVGTVFLAGRGLTGVGVSFGMVGLAAVAGFAIAVRRGGHPWLPAAIYFSQVAVGLVYIPVVRIRWGVDFIVIMYAAVALCALAGYRASRSGNTS